MFKKISPGSTYDALSWEEKEIYNWEGKNIIACKLTRTSRLEKKYMLQK